MEPQTAGSKTEKYVLNTWPERFQPLTPAEKAGLIKERVPEEYQGDLWVSLLIGKGDTPLAQYPIYLPPLGSRTLDVMDRETGLFTDVKKVKNLDDPLTSSHLPALVLHLSGVPTECLVVNLEEERYRVMTGDEYFAHPRPGYSAWRVQLQSARRIRAYPPSSLEKHLGLDRG